MSCKLFIAEQISLISPNIVYLARDAMFVWVRSAEWAGSIGGVVEIDDSTEDEE